jgi:hypothetical protein
MAALVKTTSSASYAHRKARWAFAQLTHAAGGCSI